MGENSPVHPHHRTSMVPGQVCLMYLVSIVLYGALVGGPNSDDGWVDDITDYRLNEVAIDYNAGFVGSLQNV